MITGPLMTFLHALCIFCGVILGVLVPLIVRDFIVLRRLRRQQAREHQSAPPRGICPHGISMREPCPHCLSSTGRSAR